MEGKNKKEMKTRPILNLSTGETVIDTIESIRYKNISGRLLLTNRRLIFVTKRGKLFKRYRVRISIDLEKIGNSTKYKPTFSTGEFKFGKYQFYSFYKDLLIFGNKVLKEVERVVLKEKLIHKTIMEHDYRGTPVPKRIIDNADSLAIEIVNDIVVLKIDSDTAGSIDEVEIIWTVFNEYKEEISRKVILSCYKTFTDSRGHRSTGCYLSISALRSIAKDIIRENLSSDAILNNFEVHCGGYVEEVVPFEKELTGYRAPKTVVEDEGKNIYSISPVEFENLIGHLFKSMGFDIKSTKVTGDGGIDLVAYNPQPVTGGKYIIQCKRYFPNNNVGVVPVRDLFGVVHAENANKGILITTSAFTSQAKDFAEGKPLELIDGEKLKTLLEQHLWTQKNEREKDLLCGEN